MGCCSNPNCEWHKNRAEDLRDFAGRTCSQWCSKTKGICKMKHVPETCRKKDVNNIAQEDKMQNYVPAKPPAESHYKKPKAPTPAPRRHKTYKSSARTHDFMTYEN